MAQSEIEDCSCILDTCFSGCAICSFYWVSRYSAYLQEVYTRNPKAYKPVGKEIEFVFGNHEFRDAIRASIIHIWGLESISAGYDSIGCWRSGITFTNYYKTARNGGFRKA